MRLNGKMLTHDFPLGYFESLASGEDRVSEIDDLDDWMPSLISDWLSGLEWHNE